MTLKISVFLFKGYFLSILQYFFIKCLLLDLLPRVKRICILSYILFCFYSFVFVLDYSDIESILEHCTLEVCMHINNVFSFFLSKFLNFKSENTLFFLSKTFYSNLTTQNRTVHKILLEVLSIFCMEQCLNCCSLSKCPKWKNQGNAIQNHVRSWSNLL